MKILVIACSLFISHLVFSSPAHARFSTQAHQALTQSGMPTGNGFGFAVYSPTEARLTRFYAHPYRFTRANANDPKAWGEETANFIQSMSWGIQGDAKYAQESHVIMVADGSHEEAYFLPWRLERNALVTTSTSLNRCLAVKWQSAVSKTESFELFGRKVSVLSFQGFSERIAIVPLETGGVVESDCLKGSRGWAFLALEPMMDIAPAVRETIFWLRSTPVPLLVRREVREVESWRIPPRAQSLSDDELKVWRQSEVILKIAQIREANRPGRTANGLIVASLPDGNWFIPWVRDMSYAVQALTRLGYYREAKSGLDAWLNAGPAGILRAQVRDFDYQISMVRYYGNGEEEADYSGQPYQNLEFDSWGWALIAIGDYVQRSGDTDWLFAKTGRGLDVYESVRDLVVRPLIGNLDPIGDGAVSAKIVAKDSSIWEQNFVPRMHYAASTIAAIAGLKSFLPLAERRGDSASVSEVAQAIAELELGLQIAFVRSGSLRGTLEPSARNEMDGALLEGVNVGVVKEPRLVRDLLERLSVLSVASGGYKRTTGDSNYERHEFLFIDFALARLETKFQCTAGGRELVKKILARALNDHALIPEMYVSEQNDPHYPGEIGSPTGATPMAGYGAGVYLMYMSERNLDHSSHSRPACKDRLF